MTQIVEIYAGIGALSQAAKALGGEIVMLTEKDPIARENLHRLFPDASIYNDIDDDSEWRKFQREPGAALALYAAPPCAAFAPNGKGLMDEDPRARLLLETVGGAV